MAQYLRLQAFEKLEISSVVVKDSETEIVSPLSKPLSSKAEALLCYLLIMKGEYTRVQLATLLWGEESADNAAKNSLRVELNRLRKAHPDCVSTETKKSISLNMDIIDSCDVHEFDEIVDFLEPVDDESTMAQIERAVALYRDELLTGFSIKGADEFHTWLEAERIKRQQQVMRLLKRHVTFMLDNRRYEEAQQSLQRQLQIEPWNEDAHGQMMLVLCRLGDLNGALQQYEICRQQLKDELDVQPMAETEALEDRILAARSKRPHNLPAETTPFIGRPDEINNLHKLLAAPENRLITVMGLGGIGKTSLALHVAKQLYSELATNFINGVFFVSLVSVRSFEQLLSTIADTLDVTLDRKGDTLTQVTDALQNRELLLVLDDWDSLLYSFRKYGSGSESESADLVCTLLTCCPDLKMLVTSREPLLLRLEKRLDLQGLIVPPDDADSIDEYSAVQLFVQIAKRVVPEFSVTDENRPHIIQICKTLDGMPLGIELAAAWIRVMSCECIAAKITNLDFLAAEMKDVPERQRSLRAVFEYSWQMMNEQERNAFMRLSVFSDEFTQETAQAVAELTPRVLISLFDRSLVKRASTVISTDNSADAVTGMTSVDVNSPAVDLPERYLLHNTVRQYTAEKLIADKDLHYKTRQTHSRYFANFMKQQRARLYTDDHSLALALMRQEKQNVLSAWSWTLHYLQLDDLDGFLDASEEYYILVGPYKEAAQSAQLSTEYLSGVIEQAEKPDPDALILLGRTLAYQARFLLECAEYDSALVAAKELLALAQKLNNVELRAEALNVSGLAHHRLGMTNVAVAEYQESLTLADEANLMRIVASNLRRLSIIYQSQAKYSKVRETLGRELSIRRSINDRRGEMVNLSNFGVYAVQHGDYAQAYSFNREALDLFTKIGDLGMQSHILNNVGRIYSEQRNFTAAEKHIKRAIDIKRSLDDQWGESNALLSEGRNYLFLGKYELARTIHEDALAIKRAIGEGHGEAEALIYLALIHCANNDPDAAWRHITLAEPILERNTDRFIQAQMMTVRSNILLHRNQLPEAKEAATKALEEWRARKNANLSMEPLANLAQIEFLQENHHEAYGYVSEVLEHLKAGNLDGVNFPLRIHLICYKILIALDKPQANEILKHAYDKLQTWSQAIEDQELRYSYLSINHHRQILELAMN